MWTVPEDRDTVLLRRRVSSQRHPLRSRAAGASLTTPAPCPDRTGVSGSAGRAHAAGSPFVNRVPGSAAGVRRGMSFVLASARVSIGASRTASGGTFDSRLTDEAVRVGCYRRPSSGVVWLPAEGASGHRRGERRWPRRPSTATGRQGDGPLALLASNVYLVAGWIAATVAAGALFWLSTLTLYDYRPGFEDTVGAVLAETSRGLFIATGLLGVLVVLRLVERIAGRFGERH